MGWPRRRTPETNSAPGFKRAKASERAAASSGARSGVGDTPAVDVRIFVLSRFRTMPWGEPRVIKRSRKKGRST